MHLINVVSRHATRPPREVSKSALVTCVSHLSSPNTMPLTSRDSHREAASVVATSERSESEARQKIANLIYEVLCH